MNGRFGLESGNSFKIHSQGRDFGKERKERNIVEVLK